MELGNHTATYLFCGFLGGWSSAWYRLECVLAVLLSLLVTPR